MADTPVLPTSAASPVPQAQASKPSPFTVPSRRPPGRRLRGYAFDPSLSIQLETVGINEIVYRVPWEDELLRGPIGEYLEVIDFDPASECFYEPVNLNEAYLVAQDGLTPSEGNPKFHQQMVYAVAMTTIRNFELALGRKAQWRSHTLGSGDSEREGFVQRLRIYPHAMREANAYYSPSKKALLFGYFPATTHQPGLHLAGGTVFTCLSHDIIAHETTHALLDGLHRRFIELTNPDALAFHEAFSDIVALFQHFTFPEVLRHQIAKTRGDLNSANLLGQLAQEFGVAIGNYGSLRDAIGKVDPDTGKWQALKPDPQEYHTTFEPHARGSILVAAIFDAFTAIYNIRVADLLRIATGGTGVLPSGALHPDLVMRLADEAAKAARHVLLMCIRALDYCPPVDLIFGDYLRALITADTDIVPNDDRGYRVAFIEAFRRRGIYPQNVRNLSTESLCWPDSKAEQDLIFTPVAEKLRQISKRTQYFVSRETTFNEMARLRARLHEELIPTIQNLPQFEAFTGLCLSCEAMPEGLKLDKNGKPSFEVHSLTPAQRVGPDGDLLNQMIISITQRRVLSSDPTHAGSDDFNFRGGCTLILDLDTLDLKYLIVKDIADKERLERQRRYMKDGTGGSLRATYFAPFKSGTGFEPFALLHRGS